MKKMILYAILSMFLLTGCVTSGSSYSYLNDPDTVAHLNWIGNRARLAKNADLKQCIGMTYEELIDFFAVPGMRLRGDEALDVYGTGTVGYGSYDGPDRLVFYLKNNKVYNVVKY
ncbi:MAG: hypothetical protein KJ706_03630 [Candidatus Omnitrophica bacterium]|nr:hypothetical protein [Candidatus Omnitrophota bacterium]